MSMFL